MSPRRHEGPRLWKNGFYYFDQVVDFPPNETRLRYSLKTRDPKMARILWEKERARQWSIYYGDTVDTPLSPSRLGDLILPFIEHERDVRKAKTWKTFEQRLIHVKEAWGDPLLKDIGPGLVRKLEDYLSALKPPRSKATVNHYVGLIKTFFNWAIESGHFNGQNPMKAVKPYLVEQKRRGYSDAELSKILKAAAKISKDSAKSNCCHAMKYAREIVLILTLTGMRLGEVLGLRWKCVQGDRIVIPRTETKQKREKVIPITGTVAAILAGLRKVKTGPGKEYVLPLDRLVARIEVKTLMQKIREISGVKDFCFHGLRHTAAEIMVSEALGRGTGLRDVMTVLGHSRIETTLRYDHSAIDRMRLAAEALEDRVKK